MKLPVLVTFLAGLSAQEPSPGTKIPRPPSVGIEKSFGRPPQTAPTPIETAAAAVQGRPRSVPEVMKAPLERATAGLLAAFADPEFLAFDATTDGLLWASGGNWKASFATAGWQFHGRPAEGAPDLQPIGFQLASVRIGDAPLQLGTPVPVRNERLVEYRHPQVTEALELTGRGVEQTFVFPELPRRGELQIDLAVTTSLEVVATDQGLSFRGPFDQVTYSSAVAIDARGDRIAAPTSYANGHITIRVPADFVSHATLPLRIDPLVTAITVATGTSDHADPDIAWDETGQVWAVVFSRYFGGSDWDCFVQRVSLGNPMALVGGLTTIDITGSAWNRPRIANLNVYDEFMVVAQTWPGSGVRSISGRIMGNSGVLVTTQFVVATSGVDELHPDVGGDSEAPPTYFTVVWEHAYSATDHDIYARQIDATGALRGSSPIYIQTNTLNQQWPSISKSDGGTLGAQRFAIVYQETAQPGNEDIYGAMLTWDGSFVPVGGLNTFAIDTSGYNDTFPQVSTPTLPGGGNQRLMLAVFERTNSGNSDIAATCFDQAGTIRASANINQLENSAAQAWPQYRPSVDTDGARFAVGYHEVYNGNTTNNDLDTRVTLVALGGNALFVEEPRATLGYSGNREFNLHIAARYSGSGSRSPNFCTTNDRDNIASGFAIDAYSYDATPGGSITLRSTSCGGFGISGGGQAILGGTVSCSTQATPWLAGIVVGWPQSVPIGPCPSCTLGVNGTALLGQNWSLTIPFDPSLLGVVLSAQGFVFDGAGGPCLGQIRVSDTVDMQIQ